MPRAFHGRVAVNVTGLVLAAGASVRLGEAKQLLPYRGRTLLDATLDLARSCGFGQLLVTLGGAADQVRDRVDLTGCEVVENAAFSTGCGSSISTAVRAVDPRADALVLLLGDQPGVRADDVRRLAATDAPLGVCRYADGPGHPFRFGRAVFPDLADLHGDKAVWKLLHSGRHPVTELPVDGPVPIDVDTRADYERLLTEQAR
ncbi:MULTISPECIES: nucleotidyltransferase family protein [unclassified Micromonospora]|uniref:nucleotidyltransferase family protein n=1 Tax=unclassified Micromonospora TaxID=2617518 RepID=UPI001F48E3D5|nr:nucleotidyltransferase family protein [Verrucosispora sp. SN26_14.1]